MTLTQKEKADRYDGLVCAIGIVKDGYKKELKEIEIELTKPASEQIYAMMVGKSICSRKLWKYWKGGHKEMLDIRVLYKVNEDFKQYVARFCRKHECTVNESFEWKPVKDAAEYYHDLEVGKATVTTINAGCGGAAAEMGECK